MQSKKDWIAIIAVILILALIGVLFLWYIPSWEKKQEAVQQQEAYQKLYAERTAAYESQNPSLLGSDVVFLGDGLTEGYDLVTYFPQLKAVNRGINGDTPLGIQERLGVSLYDLKPRAAVLLISSDHADTLFEHYESILRGVAENLPNSKVLILSVPPTSGEFADRNGQTALNNVKIKALAERFGFLYVDVFSALLDYGTSQLRADATTDGLHLSPLGYQILTDLLTPHLSDLPELPAETEPESGTESETAAESVTETESAHE